MDGYRPQAPANYDFVDLLNDAIALPVIIYDTAHKAAIWTNAENLILHALLHKQSISTSITPVQDSLLSVIEGASSDRRLKSTRQAMLSNADRVIALRSHLKKPGCKATLFKSEVERLYHLLTNLQERTFPTTSGAKKLEFHFGRHRLNGWEYMSLIKDSTSQQLLPKSVALGDDHGGWYKYARDSRALTIFASNFANSFQPSYPELLCPDCQPLWRSHCYLTVRTTEIKRLLDEYRDEKYPSRMSDDDWTLQSPEDPFRPCNHKCGGPTSRVTKLVRRPGRNYPHFNYDLPINGAIVIGNLHARNQSSRRHARNTTRTKHLRRSGRPLAPNGGERLRRTISRQIEGFSTHERSRAPLSLDYHHSLSEGALGSCQSHDRPDMPSSIRSGTEPAQFQYGDIDRMETLQKPKLETVYRENSANLDYDEISSNMAGLGVSTSVANARREELQDTVHIHIPGEDRKLILLGKRKRLPKPVGEDEHEKASRAWICKDHVRNFHGQTHYNSLSHLQPAPFPSRHGNSGYHQSLYGLDTNDESTTTPSVKSSDGAIDSDPEHADTISKHSSQ